MFFAEATINGLKVDEDFCDVSGLKLNKDKTEGVWLSRGVNRNDNFASINWDKNIAKAFWVHFEHDKNEVELKNWEEKRASIESCLRCWNTRDLSIKGRIQVIKTLALAKVVSLSASLHTLTGSSKRLIKRFFALFSSCHTCFMLYTNTDKVSI